MSYSILIVDDERLSRDYIGNMVKEYMPLASVKEASSAKTGRAILESESIDVLILDINMSAENGFDLLQSLEARNFQLIFVTAFKEYAINAIRHNAFDYLLKPVKKIDFKNSLRKVIEKIDQMRTARKNTDEHAPGDYLDTKLTISHQHGMRIVTLREIVYLEASNTYTTLFLSSGEKITTSKPINKFESSLNQKWFFRIHKSHIVNILHLKEYRSTDFATVLMDNGAKLYVSRYRLTEFLNTLKNSGIKL